MVHLAHAFTMKFTHFRREEGALFNLPKSTKLAKDIAIDIDIAIRSLDQGQGLYFTASENYQCISC